MWLKRYSCCNISQGLTRYMDDVAPFTDPVESISTDGTFHDSQVFFIFSWLKYVYTLFEQKSQKVLMFVACR